MRASGAGEPYWRITNGLRRVNGTGVPGRLQAVKLYSTRLQIGFPVQRLDEAVAPGCTHNLRPGQLNASCLREGWQLP